MLYCLFQNRFHAVWRPFQAIVFAAVLLGLFACDSKEKKVKEALEKRHPIKVESANFFDGPRGPELLIKAISERKYIDENNYAKLAFSVQLTAFRACKPEFPKAVHVLFIGIHGSAMKTDNIYTRRDFELLEIESIDEALEQKDQEAKKTD